LLQPHPLHQLFQKLTSQEQDFEDFYYHFLPGKKRQKKERNKKKRKEKKRKEKKRKEKKRKYYTFRRQFNEKPGIMPGWPGTCCHP